MKARRRAREVALQLLYRYDSAPTPPTNRDLAAEITQHFDHWQVPDASRGFAAELVAGTIGRLATLDGLLEKHAKNWKVTRMSSIDRSLLRMAVYELLNFPDIPPSVTIDEAIELGKQFGNAETGSFINGILDAISREHPKSATAKAE